MVHRKTEEALQVAEKENDLWMYQNEKEEAKRLQGVRKLRKDDDMAWPDWEEAGKMEDGEWRLEPEGEVEVSEIIIVSDAVEGTPVDLVGESRHEQVEAKLSKRVREMLNDGEEVRSPKRKSRLQQPEPHGTRSQRSSWQRDVNKSSAPGGDFKRISSSFFFLLCSRTHVNANS